MSWIVLYDFYSTPAIGPGYDWWNTHTARRTSPNPLLRDAVPLTDGLPVPVSCNLPASLSHLTTCDCNRADPLSLLEIERRPA